MVVKKSLSNLASVRVDNPKSVRYAEGRRRLKAKRRFLQTYKERPIRFSEKKLVAEIMQEAKILRIHTDAAELVARRVGQKVAKWAKTRKTITTTELNTRVARELSTYDPDLAFLYQNRDKII